MYSLLVILASAVLASTTPVELDRSVTPDADTVAPRMRANLTGAFAPGGEPVQTSDGVRVDLPSMEVVVARIGPDGRPILACVDNEAAARRFLDARSADLRSATPKEK